MTAYRELVSEAPLLVVVRLLLLRHGEGVLLLQGRQGTQLGLLVLPPQLGHTATFHT